jgi:hypothetical protein
MTEEKKQEHGRNGREMCTFGFCTLYALPGADHCDVHATDTDYRLYDKWKEAHP